MALSGAHTPMRRLFRDIGNIPTRSEPSTEDLIDRICKLQISTFRQKYQFDLGKMQPCAGEKDVRGGEDGQKIRHCWSWEAVDAKSVPAFYRPCIARSRRLVRKESPVSVPAMKTPVKPPKESGEKCPQINTIFPTVRRSSSLAMDSKPCVEPPRSRCQSLIPMRKSTPDSIPTSSPTKTHLSKVIYFAT